MASNFTVLLVDDSATRRTLLKARLLRSGIQVMEAKDGLDACGKLRALGSGTRLGAVLTDEKMPGMGGLALERWVREAKGLQDLPVFRYSVGVDPGPWAQENILERLLGRVRNLRWASQNAKRSSLHSAKRESIQTRNFPPIEPRMQISAPKSKGENS